MLVGSFQGTTARIEHLAESGDCRVFGQPLLGSDSTTEHEANLSFFPRVRGLSWFWNGHFYDFTEKPEKIMVFNLRELNQSCFFLNNSSRITFGYIQKLRSCLKPKKLEGWEALRQGVVNEPP